MNEATVQDPKGVLMIYVSEIDTDNSSGVHCQLCASASGAGLGAVMA